MISSAEEWLVTDACEDCCSLTLDSLAVSVLGSSTWNLTLRSVLSLDVCDAVVAFLEGIDGLFIESGSDDVYCGSDDDNGC